MRKAEKLSEAIGKISDDLIEEAYAYKPKQGNMHHRNRAFKWKAAAAVLAVFLLAGIGVSVGGGTSFFRIGTLVSKLTGKTTKEVYRIQGVPVTQQEIQTGVVLRVGNGKSVKTAKAEVTKDIITKKTLYALAEKNGCTVSDQEYETYAAQLKEQMKKAQNKQDIEEFYKGFGGEDAYWKNMEPVIRQNLAVRKYIDSQTGTQTEEEIRQEAYEQGTAQTDLNAFEQVVDDACEAVGDYLKTLQKSEASVYYFERSDRDRVLKSLDEKEICAIGNNTVVTKEQVQMYTKFYEITYDKTLSEKKAAAYAKERNALYVAAMQNGYQVTDEQVKAYVEELKQNLDGIWTKEQKEKLLSGFASEDDYWAFEQKVYRINLPIQNYVRDKENEFNRKNDSGQTWDDTFETLKQKLVDRQQYKDNASCVTDRGEFVNRNVFVNILSISCGEIAEIIRYII